MCEVWFTADFHLGHQNIIRYCSGQKRQQSLLPRRLLPGFVDVTRFANPLLRPRNTPRYPVYSPIFGASPLPRSLHPSTNGFALRSIGSVKDGALTPREIDVLRLVAGT